MEDIYKSTNRAATICSILRNRRASSELPC